MSQRYPMKLLDIIREKSESHCTGIIEKQQQESQTVIEEAKRIAEEMRSRIIRKVQDDADRLRERKHNAIRFRINARCYEVKARALDRIWAEAEDLIRSIERPAATVRQPAASARKRDEHGKSDTYGGILEKLFFECLPEAPDGAVVHVAPDDVGFIVRCIDRSGRQLSLVEDADVHGGVEFHWPDGKTVLKNTLSHRLARLKNEGNAGLSSILFASEEDSET